MKNTDEIRRKKLTTDITSGSILHCADRFAPERYALYEISPSNDWIIDGIKNAITKRDILFEQWIKDPKQENRESYRRQRNLVTYLISNAKRACNYQKLGINPTTKTIYRTLKKHSAKNQDSVPSQDIETLNKYFTFTTIGSKLPEALPKSECKYFKTTFEKQWF